MRSLAGKRKNSSNDEAVELVMIGKNVGNDEVINKKVGSKVTKFESIFSSSWGLFLKESVESNILNQQKSATNDLYSDLAWKENGKLLISSLETVNKRLDKLVWKEEYNTRKINRAVLQGEQEIAQMERRIVSEEGGITLLTELSVSLNSQLCKIEPAVDSSHEVKKQVTEIKLFCESLRMRIVEATMKIDELVQLKQNRKLINLSQVKKTTTVVAMLSAQLVRDKYNGEQQLSVISKNIIELKAVTNRLRNNLSRQLRKRDEEIENVRWVRECVKKFSNEKEWLKRNIATIKSARNAAIKKVASLEKDISIRVRQSVVENPIYEPSEAEVLSSKIEKVTDVTTLQCMISDLCQQNKSLKKDLSETTSRVLNLMVTLSTIGET